MTYYAATIGHDILVVITVVPIMTDRLNLPPGPIHGQFGVFDKPLPCYTGDKTILPHNITSRWSLSGKYKNVEPIFTHDFRLVIEIRR